MIFVCFLVIFVIIITKIIIITIIIIIAIIIFQWIPSLMYYVCVLKRHLNKRRNDLIRQLA